MDRETLSHYGWIVILVLILAVLLALATPFGLFVADGFKATYAGFEMVGQNALGIVIPGSNPESNVVPDGGTYYVGVTASETGDYTGYTAKYEAGDTLPDVVNVGDIYVYQDYEYRYGQYWAPVPNSWGNAADTSYSKDWGARVLDTTKTSYTNPLSHINGKPVNNFSYTWNRCPNFETAPVIPETAKTLHWAFEGCSSLINAPVIPNGVYSVCGMFISCNKLEVAPLMPDSVKDMQSTFSGCYILKSYVGSTDADGDFSNYKLPANIESLYCTFDSCSSMTVAPFIPETVTNVKYTFYGPPKSPNLTGKLYLPCHLTDNEVYWMYYSGSSVEIVRYCISSCTGCSNCHADCGH